MHKEQTPATGQEQKQSLRNRPIVLRKKEVNVSQAQIGLINSSRYCSHTSQETVLKQYTHTSNDNILYPSQTRFEHNIDFHNIMSTAASAIDYLDPALNFIDANNESICFDWDSDMELGDCPEYRQ